MIEKVYQTFETVFHLPYQQCEFRQKYAAARRILLSSQCLDIPMKHCLSYLIYITSKITEHHV